jgi:hypothetical protein
MPTTVISTVQVWPPAIVPPSNLAHAPLAGTSVVEKPQSSLITGWPSPLRMPAG